MCRSNLVSVKCRNAIIYIGTVTYRVSENKIGSSKVDDETKHRAFFVAITAFFSIYSMPPFS